MNPIDETVRLWAIKNFGLAGSGSPKWAGLAKELKKVAVSKHEVLIELMTKQNDLSLATYKTSMDKETRLAYDFAYKIIHDLIKKFEGEDGTN